MRPAPSRAPLVSVVMAVYDGARFVGEAIASVLAQTHAALELIVVDDGSADGTAAIVDRWRARDPRVQLARRAHLGHAQALNAGIELAEGAFIARIDHDDVWRADKLALQLAFMQRAGVDVCGSWVRRFGAAGGVIRFATSHEAIRYETLFTCPILDSATVFRSDLLRANPYPPEALVRQELLQCVRLIDVARFANLPRYLTDYRVHADQKTQRFAPMIRHRQQALCVQHFRRMFPGAPDADVALFERIAEARRLSLTELAGAGGFFVRYLKSGNAEVRLRMGRRWRRMARAAAGPRGERARIFRATYDTLCQP